MTPEDAVERTLALIESLFGGHRDEIAVRFWEGTVWPDDSPKPATIVLNHPATLSQMFRRANEVALAEAYLFDDFDVEGDMEAVHGLADTLQALLQERGAVLRLLPKVLRLPRRDMRREADRGSAQMQGQQHTVDRDRQAISYHYDVSNDFYQLWLDQRMVYSCGYFRTMDGGLDQAQADKLDMLCRKLRLQPGQRLLDLGCGWGGLLIWAAEHYGVDATGITLSKEQATLANERIAEAGLSDRCRVRVQDYREVQDWGTWDALVSVGMFEHVGKAMLPTYFERALCLLKPGGVFLNHGIARNYLVPWRRKGTFTQAYVFPDGELVPIAETVDAAEAVGFEVRDVESLREHYALTLRHWVRRLEAHHEEALRHVSEPTYRVWRLFMSGSAHGFGSGRLNLYQTLLVKPNDTWGSGLPLTREGWYRG